MTRRGWAGNPPTDDQEARARIVAAAMACVDRHGPTKTGLSDVAAALGITRQTVYRHFASTDELLEAVAQAGADSYLDELQSHLEPIRDPAGLVVEAIAHTVERLPKDPYVGVLLTPGRTEMFWRGATSELARRFGRAMLTRTNVDWSSLGFSEQQLDGLVEFSLRLLASLITEPNPDHAAGPELRAYLERWVAPAITKGIAK
jgi:AcrR family transcriptional regulator